MIRVFAACGLYERSVCLIWSLCCVVFSLCLASSALAQTPPSDCTRPNQSSGQQDGGSRGGASGCIRDAKKMTYGVVLLWSTRRRIQHEDR